MSADNPAVTTVLELTEANCVPSNRNITVQVETRSSVTPQLYARDLAIAAVVCFIGENGTQQNERKWSGLLNVAVLRCHKFINQEKLKRIRFKTQENIMNNNHIIS